MGYIRYPKICIMIIKFKDNFESILYAVLYSNLTGYILSPQNEAEGLFKNEVFVDIDNLNWQEIINQHDQKFGEIKWLKNKNSDWLLLKSNVDYALRHWKPFKYKVIIETTRQALRFGLSYVNNKTTTEAKNLYDLAGQVKREVHRALGFIRFIPVERNKEKFLLGYFEEESKVGDLVVKNFSSRYYGYHLLIKTPKLIYLLYQGRVYQLSTDKFNLEVNDKNFEKFWEVFYQANFIPQRKNTRLAKQLIPKKYWSWVKEGKMINLVDKGLI